MKSNVFILAMLLACMPFAVFSQFSVSGSVTDKNSGKKLSDAHIILKDNFKSTITDANGNYSVNNLKKGKYTFRVSYLGYKTIERIVTVEKNEEINFSMENSPVMEDEVIIRAIKANEKSPTTFKNIFKKDIKKINLGQDLPALLETTPSIVTTSDAGAGIGYTALRIRGTDMTRINFTINGVPLNDPESQGTFLVDMPDLASSINNIQIQRGVGTSTNGAAAFGASINIQTLKLQPKPYAEINSSAGSFNTFKNNVSFGTGLINGKWCFDGRLSKISSDGYVDRAFSDLKSFYTSASYYGKKSIVKLIISSGKEKTYQAWNGIPKDSLKTNRTYNPYTYDNETDNYIQTHYQLHYSKEINENLNFNTALFLIQGKGYYEQYKENRKFSDYLLNNVIIGSDTILRTDLIQQKWLDNDFYGLTYSLNYHKNNVQTYIGGAWNKYDGDHFGRIIWAQYASNGAKDYQWYFNNGKKRDFNIFGKINYSLTDRLNLYGDIQYRKVNYSIDGNHDDLRNLTQEHNFNFLNPKAGIFYKINDNQDAYFSFAISNREPNRSNYCDADNGNIPESEKLLDYELGYSLKTNNFKIDANFYYMNYKNQLVLTGKINNVGAAIMTNVPKSYRMGLELSSELIFNKNLKWDINASFSKNKIKNFTEYVDNWSYPYTQIVKNLGTTDLSFSPDIIAGSIISYSAKKNLEFKFISKYVGRQFIDNTSCKDRSLDPYFVNNINFVYRFYPEFIKEIDFNVVINNLFSEEYETNAWVYRYYYENKHYVMDGYFPQAGINFLAGISAKL